MATRRRSSVEPETPRPRPGARAPTTRVAEDTPASGTPRLLAGGNPQIPKGDGEAPVRAWLEALPGWKRPAAERLDALIAETVPGVRRAVRWNSPMYGVGGDGFFLGVHALTRYLKIAFFRGAELEPPPPEPSKDEAVRYFHVYEERPLDEAALRRWIAQAAALPGWSPGGGRASGPPAAGRPNPEVEAWIAGRKSWRAEAERLRSLLRGRGLDETIRWGKPCFSVDGRNVAILQPMKGFLALMFFKGALMKSRDGVLVAQGENSHAARRIEFTSTEQVEALAPVLHACVDEAIAIARSGAEAPRAPALELVEELSRRLEADPALRAAFEALTPGRRREYHLHVSGAKRSETRERRIDAVVPRILAGKGMRDR